MPDPNQLLGQGPPAKKQKLTETKLIGHIDDDTSLRELQSLDLKEPDWRASSSSTQRPGPKLISEAPELKQGERLRLKVLKQQQWPPATVGQFNQRKESPNGRQ